jgi:hypothetical protein
MAYKSPYDFASRITSNISYDEDGNAIYYLQKPSVSAPQTTFWDDDGLKTGNDPNYAFDWNSNQWIGLGLQQADAALSKQQYKKVDWNYNDIYGDRASIGDFEFPYNDDEYRPPIRGFGVNDIWGGTRYTSGWVTSLDHLEPTQREANVIAGQARDKLWQTYDNMVQQGHQPEKTPDELAIEFYVKNGGNQSNDPYGPGVNTAALSEVLTQQFMNQPSVLAVTGKPYVTDPEKLTSINDFGARHSSPQVLNTFAVFGRQHVPSRDIIGDVLMGVMMAVATWGIGTAVSLAASTALLGAEAVTGILAAAEASGISVASALATALPGVNVVSAVAVAEMTGGNPLTAAITAGFDSAGSLVKGDVFNSITSNFPDIPVPVVNAVTNAAIAAGKAGLTGQDWETAVTNSLTSSAIGVGATAIGQDIPPTLIKAIVPVIGTAITGGDVTKAIINAGIQNAGSLFKDSADQDFKNLEDKLERGDTLTPAENDRLYNFYSNFNKPPDSDQPKVITNLDNEPITKSAEIIAQEEAGTRAIQGNTIVAAGLSDTQTDAPPVYSIVDTPPYVGIARSDSSPTGFVYLGEDGEKTIVNEDGSPYEEPAAKEPQTEEVPLTPAVEPPIGNLPTDTSPTIIVPESNLPTSPSIIVPDSNLPTSPSGEASPDMSGVTFVGVDGSGNGIYTDGSNNYDSSGNVITEAPNVGGSEVTGRSDESFNPDVDPTRTDESFNPDVAPLADVEPDNWDKQGLPTGGTSTGGTSTSGTSTSGTSTGGNLPTAKSAPSTSGISGALPSASSLFPEDNKKYDSPVKAMLQPNWLSTGAPSQSTMYAGLDPKLVNILSQRSAHGGQIHPRLQQVLSNRGFEINPVEMVAGPEDRYYARHAKRGFAVNGEGTGQSDDIPTMLADGEYVFDADTVAALGDGSSKAGAAALDKMREEIRKHKRSAPVDKIPPKAKSPLDYLVRKGNKHG